GARAIVELAAFLYAELFRDGDLNVVYPLASPQRFEQGITETHRHQVLHRLFAQVVIDAVDLVFVKPLAHSGIDRVGRFQVMSQRLLQYHTRVGMIKTDGGQLTANRYEQLWGCRQVADGDATLIRTEQGRQRFEIWQVAGV